MKNKNLRMAIQNKGRLSDKSVALLKACGLDIEYSPRQLLASTRSFDLEILFVRDDDIPEYVQDGVADIGIVGENEVWERQRSVDIIEKLGFGNCRMSIAVPKSFDYRSIHDLEGKRIATSYPVILGKYLKKEGVNAQIHRISGSVEISPGIDLADAIFDIVSTGSTLISNGLKEVQQVVASQAVLIAHKGLNGRKKELLSQLIFRIRAVNTAKNNKYILLNAPNEALKRITEILPGIKSPTVMPLAKEGWSSVHTVISEDAFWENIESLKAAGAQGILVIPIEKMIV